jgi:hypothetical protein
MTTLEEAAREFGFNPDQKRGPDGKWLFVGAVVKHVEHGIGQVTDKHMGGKVSVSFKGDVKKVDKADVTPVYPGTSLRDMKKQAKDRVKEVGQIVKAERHEKKSRDKR